MRNRLNTAAWGLLLVWSGVIVLWPADGAWSWHAWLLGAGVILLGAAAISLRRGWKPGPETWILGVVGVVAGLAGLLGASVSAIGVGLVAFGLAYLITSVRAPLAGPA